MSEYCNEAMKQVYRYLDGEMTWWRAREIRHHLEDCPPCGEAFSYEDHFLKVVRQGLKEEPPTEMMERLRAVLRSEEAG